ncbi:urease accessory protein UreD [uncultured Roseovarius sp.]|uniref:urease accessory protein UreD n=1 Tax=uncultured Roseovarius sp. TaxID=293344 RepID=UPI0025DCCA93|nr:urease accessory protein UreD [uncultured Roseovarius sp.]
MRQRPAITKMQTHIAHTTPPRARGQVALSSKLVNGQSVLADLHQSGAFKVLFPRGNDALRPILLNTAGGLTGGDRFALDVHVAAGTHISLTTQAAERAYRAQPGEVGDVQTTAKVQDGGCLHWLPQELILYNGCALERQLRIDLSATARLLMVEPVVFGRAAMGETVTAGHFKDRIEVTRAGCPLYRDALRLKGDIAAKLAGPGTAQGAAAMASGLYVAPNAEAMLDAVRQHLGDLGGASLLQADALALRLIAPDSHILRQHLLPVLDLLSQSTLPVSWRL